MQQKQELKSPVQHLKRPSANSPIQPITWPFFKPEKIMKVGEKFWDKKINKIPPKTSLLYSGNLLRIGKNKSNPKNYFFKVTNDGQLFYFKKDGESQAKGSIKLSMSVIAHLEEHSNKKETQLVVRIERLENLSISIFDTKTEGTLEIFEILKDFCLVSGFDRIYSQQELLGRGSFASVYKVKSYYGNRSVFAAKTYFRETFENSQHKDKFVVMIKNEIMALRKVIHPGIIRLYEVIQEKEKLILIMELVNGGDLYVLIKEIKRVPEKKAAYMLKQVAESLREMHLNGFVHRDLKLENIMLREKGSWDIKLVDFGFAEPINEKELVSKAGTPGYIPPEIFKLNPYTAKGDVFSVGVIFYSLISGMSAFKGKNYSQVLHENRKCEINFDRSVWNEVSPECKAILKKMLSPKPQTRYSCNDILEHEWIVENTTDQDKKANSSSMVGFQKMMTKQKSFYNPSSGGSDFECEFSYRTNDLKSFYQRFNSQKTFKSFKSQKSGISNMKKSMGPKNSARAASANYRNQFQQIKSPTLKASIHQKKDDIEIQEEKKQGYASEYHGINDDEDYSTNDMFDDNSIPIHNINFLGTSLKTFNKTKKPQAFFPKKF